MHDPPTPEIGDGEGFLDPGERDHAEEVEDGDVDRRRPDQVLEPDAAGPELTRRLTTARRGWATGRGTSGGSRPPGRRRSRSARTGRAGCRRALVAEPEPALVDHALDAEIVAGQGRGDNHQRDPEQRLDQHSLAASLASAGDRRSEEKAAGDPAQTDPDDRRLGVEAA